jgi:hypothetical protein
MKTTRTVLVLLVTSVLLLCGALAIGAPPSAKSPEGDPRTRIDGPLPVTITSPGSYYLGANLIGVSGAHGITIAASDVTLDLNGFELVGVFDAFSGVHVDGARHNIVVQNGHVRGWGNDGIDVNEAIGGRLEDVGATSNGGTGFHLGVRFLVRGCHAMANSAAGFSMESGAVIENSIASENVGDGFGANQFHYGATLDGCVATENQGFGFVTGDDAVVRACTARDNFWDGFYLGQGSQVEASVATVNGGHGFRISGATGISRSTARGNGIAGISVWGNGSDVRDNTVDGNGGSGIDLFAGFHNRIDGNLAIGNGSAGITIGFEGFYNVVVRNVAGGNAGGEYSIIGMSQAGPIDGVAVATSPWANLVTSYVPPN